MHVHVKTRSIAFAAVAAAAGGLLLAGCDRATGSSRKKRTATVGRRDFSTKVLATGVVRPQLGAEVRVGARISGRVERLHANIGDTVEQGQPIAELEKAELQAEVAKREAELSIARAKLARQTEVGPTEIEEAQASVVRFEATVELARKEFAREEALLKRGISSRDAHDMATERLSVAKAQLASLRKSLELAGERHAADLTLARAEVDRAMAAVASARARLAYATISAPISGTVASVTTQEGETVSAGLSAPTFVTIIDLGRLQVDAFVDEVDIGKVAPGQTASFTVDAFPGRAFEGRVVAIYPKAVIEENVVNYDVVLRIDTPYEKLLRPEMTASVSIFPERRSDVLAVPADAVRRSRGRSVVEVLVDGAPQPREVKAGARDGRWVEIVSGLSEGETVLLKEKGGDSADGW
jgi:macrolide-specific efflux system membrane fusion protein